MAQAFLLSLMVPFNISVGAILLTPHRLVLLVLFVPLFANLYVFRRVGPVLLADWLFLAFVLWTGVAFAVNHPIGEIIEPFGIHTVEFMGGYMLARVAIRSSADFMRVVWTLFILVAALLPFALIESISGRPVLLEIIPGTTVKPIYADARLGLRRAQTIFVHPILFGVFVSSGLGLFWYALRPQSLKFIGAPLAVAATFVSLSAGALLSVVAQSIFIGWETLLRTLRRRWRLFFVLSVAGYVTIDLLSNRTPFHVLVTYGTFYQSSAYGRITIWNYGIENVWANPVFGLGLRDWARPAWLPDSVDNFWLLNAMRYGLPGIALFIAALIVMIRQVALAALTTPDDRRARAAYLVVFGGITIAGGTVHYWHAMLAFVMLLYGSGLWTVSGGAVTGGNAAEPTTEERRSRYTRQLKPGMPIGADVSGRATTALTGLQSSRSRDKEPRAAPPSRTSHRRS